MAVTVNAVGASKRFFEIKYSKYQRYLLLQLIQIVTTECLLVLDEPTKANKNTVNEEFCVFFIILLFFTDM